MDLKSANFELHIDQLVLVGVEGLEGLEGIDREVVGEVFRREFERLVLEHGVPKVFREGESFTNLSVSPIQLSLPSDIESIGTGLAQKIYGRVES